MKHFLLALAFISSFSIFAQEGLVPAYELLRDRAEEIGVSQRDLVELRTTDSYASASGVEHVYVEQMLFGTPVYNAIASVHFRKGGDPYYTSEFQADLRGRMSGTVPSIDASAAFRRTNPSASTRMEEADLTYYALTATDKLYLSWQLVVEDTDAGMHTLFLVDAVGGNVLYTTPLTISCNFGDGHSVGGNTDKGRDELPARAGAKNPVKSNVPFLAPVTPQDGSMYLVFPFGLESPLDGDRELVFEPADPVASPFGYHDIDGKAGAEYTYTRGNNAYAYRDQDTTNNVPDTGFVADGGEALDFDFAFTPPQSADSVTKASIVQLFYMTNKLHDWSALHGFDEAAGNFQVNNYGRGGLGGDAVNAETQDVTGTNNANFYTPRDGRPPRMQMYLWPQGSLVTVNSPAEIAGDLSSLGASFGNPVVGDPITADVVQGFDGTTSPSFGCEVLVNPEEIKGKIAIIDRGGCAFELKALNAQTAGAIGMIISNVDNGLISMGGSGDLGVTIPSVMVRKSDGDTIRKVLNGDRSVEASIKDNGSTPLDGSFDNGVVAHEFGHGISTRLVGGPKRAACLRNAEQMGEGWSDFFALASSPTSATDNPTGAEPRGIGIYSIGNSDGRGFRSQYYSTDFAINNKTYDDVILAAVPHGVGETWAATLWDVYWKMVEAYGYDEDLINGTGGNNAAVRLVIEALKFTKCSPGLVDGRDGLLAADRFENGGANQCLLWEVFQRRGLGPSAYQGTGARRDDNREAFDLLPSCIATVKVVKTSDTLNLSAGDPVTYTLTVSNHKPTGVSELTVTDELPQGLTVTASSINGGASQSLTAGALTFTIDTLAPGEDLVLSYTAVTDPGVGSKRVFFSGAEEVKDSLITISSTDTTGWVRNDTTPYAGELSWYVANLTTEQDNILQTRKPFQVSGTRPVLRFFTNYMIEAAYDAGVVQISLDTTNWENIDDDFLRFGYRGEISANGSEALQDQLTFWGDSRGYQEVIVDLAKYAGRSVYVRWRFVSDDGGAERGWWVDNIEIMSDLVAYDGTATVTTKQGDRATGKVADVGVVVESYVAPNSVEGRIQTNATVNVYPNPARTMTTVALSAARPGTLDASIFSVGGRLVRSSRYTLVEGSNLVNLPVGELPTGVYTLRLTEPEAVTTVKLTITR